MTANQNSGRGVGTVQTTHHNPHSRDIHWHLWQSNQNCRPRNIDSPPSSISDKDDARYSPPSSGGN